MKYIFLFLLGFSSLFADENSLTSTITVHATANVEIPADQIIFRVTISAEKIDPQIAFEEHKKLETKLLNMLSQFQIPDSNITYSLLNLHSYTRSRENHGKREDINYYRSGQTVHIVFNNIESYLSFQVALLKNGFNQFSASFSSTHVEGLKEAGYKKALKIAEKNATIIAINMGKKLGPILHVITETGDKFEFENPEVTKYMRDVSTNLTDIQQTVSTKTTLRVVYQLL